MTIKTKKTALFLLGLPLFVLFFSTTLLADNKYLCLGYYNGQKTLKDNFYQLHVSSPNTYLVLGLSELIDSRIKKAEIPYQQIMSKINQKSSKNNLVSQLELYNVSEERFFKTVQSLSETYNTYLNDPSHPRKKEAYKTAVATINTLTATLKKTEFSMRSAIKDSLSTELEIEDLKKMISDVVLEISELSSHIKDSGHYADDDLSILNQIFDSKKQLLKNMVEILNKFKKSLSEIVVSASIKLSLSSDSIRQQLNLLESDGISLVNLENKKPVLESQYVLQSKESSAVGTSIINAFNTLPRPQAIVYLNDVLAPYDIHKIPPQDFITFEEAVTISQIVKEGTSNRNYYLLDFRGTVNNVSGIPFKNDKKRIIPFLRLQSFTLLTLLRRVAKQLNQEQLNYTKNLIIHDLDSQIQNYEETLADLVIYNEKSLIEKMTSRKPHLPFKKMNVQDMETAIGTLYSVRSYIQDHFSAEFSLWHNQPYRHVGKTPIPAE